MQLELGFWPVGSLRECNNDYLARGCDSIADATRLDYEERARWLEAVFGAQRPIDSIGLDDMERVWDRWGPKGHGLKGVTVKRRFTFLRSVAGRAVDKKKIKRDDIPPMPKIPNDGTQGGPVLTVDEFNRFVKGLPPEERWERCASIYFWTGHHAADVNETAWWMLDPDRTLNADDGTELCRGMFWRRNCKNKKLKGGGIWFPMEAELRELVIKWRKETPDWKPDDLVIGNVYNVWRTFTANCRRVGLPSVSPRGMRTSFASMLSAREYSNEFIRQALAHKGEPMKTAAGGMLAMRPTVATLHYMMPSTDLLAQRAKRRATGG